MYKLLFITLIFITTIFSLYGWGYFFLKNTYSKPIQMPVYTTVVGLAIWGFIGGVLFLPGILLGMFDLTDPTLLFAPLGLQEMALAVWLIVKGFNSSE